MKRILIVDDLEGWINFQSDVIKELYKDEEIEIITANSATKAYDILLEKQNLDIIITDLQMEENYSPLYAGEWLIEQIRNFNNYLNTKIIIISGSYNIRQIANHYGVNCIPKSTATKCISAYAEILGVKYEL